MTSQLSTSASCPGAGSTAPPTWPASSSNASPRWAPSSSGTSSTSRPRPRPGPRSWRPPRRRGRWSARWRFTCGWCLGSKCPQTRGCSTPPCRQQRLSTVHIKVRRVYIQLQVDTYLDDKQHLVKKLRYIFPGILIDINLYHFYFLVIYFWLREQPNKS